MIDQLVTELYEAAKRKWEEDFLFLWFRTMDSRFSGKRSISTLICGRREF